MPFIAQVSSAAAALPDQPASGTGSADAPGGFDPLQHLPSLRSIAAHAIGGAVGGILGGPMGMLGGAALSVVGAFVEAAISPGTGAAAATSAGLSAAPANSGLSAGADQASASGGPAAAPLMLGAASATGGVSGADGSLAQRALAALNAYDRTTQNGATAPGQILA